MIKWPTKRLSRCSVCDRKRIVCVSCRRCNNCGCHPACTHKDVPSLKDEIEAMRTRTLRT